MLVVKDYEGLEKFGFEKNGIKNRAGRDLWWKVYRNEDDDMECHIVVDPLFATVEGELAMYVESRPSRTGSYMDVPTEQVMHLVALGIVEWTPDKGELP